MSTFGVRDTVNDVPQVQGRQIRAGTVNSVQKTERGFTLLRGTFQTDQRWHLPHFVWAFMMLSPKLLLSPIDFSDASLGALGVAKDIAKQFGSTILLLHAMPVVPKLTEDLSVLHRGAYELELLEAAKRRLGDLAEQVQQTGVDARSSIGVTNDAASEITRTAEHEQVNLIVISTQGLTGWRRFAFGSVAEKVVRTAPCPVLVVRAVATAEAMDAGAGK